MSRSDLDRIKTGVENSIDALESVQVEGFALSRHKNAPVDVTSIKKVKDSLEVYREGIDAVKNMIEFVYNTSQKEGADSNVWLERNIKRLIKTAADAKEYLLKGIIMRIPNSSDEGKKDNQKDFFKAKQSILKDYDDVHKIHNDLLKTLEDKVDGNINMGDRGVYEESWCEKYAKNDKGKAGYREDIDAIVIDPKGSVGEIRDVYGLRIALPEKPKDLEDYINSHIKTRKSQKWKRERRPNNITRKSEQNFKGYIKDQFDKKRNGVWFLNNGQPTYITGAHWFLLQWCKTNAKKGGWFHFRKAHMDLFYFMEACYVDPRCLGMVLVKTRRTGATFATLAFKLSKAITKRNVAFGMTSKTNIDAKKNFKYLTTMLRYLPFWFKPLSVSDDSKSVIEFKQPTVKTSSKNKDQETKYVALETEMSYLSTSEDSYDGYALDVYIGDEISKWPKGTNTSIKKHWEKISLAMTEGGNFDGIALLLSTVEHVTGDDDPNSSDARSGDHFKHIYYASDPEERNENGHTPSLLYRLFIPCDENYGGFIDEYGFPVKRLKKGEKVMGVDGEWITKGILDYLEIRAGAIKNAGDLNDFWRKNPRSIEEAFRVASADCVFQDVFKIVKQANYIESQFDKIERVSTLYDRGRFEWINGNQFGPVKFVRDMNGKFRVSWIPPEERQNRFMTRNGNHIPLNTHYGAFGVDPYRANKVKGGGSKCGIHGLIHPQSGLDNAGAFFLEYIDREKNVETLTEEIIKICNFYGMKALIENNVTDVVRYMKSWGFRGYSMDRPDKKPDQLRGNDKDYGGIPGTSKDLIAQLTNQIEMYITDFIDPDDIDIMNNMPFRRTLDEWLVYDPDKRTKYDAAVSSSLAIFACNSALSPIRERQESKPVDMTNTFHKFRRNGGRSRKIHRTAR